MSVRVNPPAPPGRVSYYTLTTLRWISLAGQLSALLITEHFFNLNLPLGPALLVILTGVGVNLLAGGRLSVFQNFRPTLGQHAVEAHLLFDTLQLGCLLLLTGGLTNPFVIMLLTPITVAATLLPWRQMFMIMLSALGMLVVITLWSHPLPWPGDGLPPLYIFGVNVALALAAAFIAFYVWQMAEESRGDAAALARAEAALAEARQRAAVGALAASAAHALGTPLSTITIIARELAKDVPAESPLRADIDILQTQAARCRNVLSELSRNASSNAAPDFAPLEEIPLDVLLNELAAKPGGARADVVWNVECAASARGDMPMMPRRPELMHGLGNLIDNAFQFARQEVWVELDWNERDIHLRLCDDGPGFSEHILHRLGEPYLSTRAGLQGHMGLGVFTALTLLEMTQARLEFHNDDEGGAIIDIFWPRGPEAGKNPA